jgi:hypothetical protein
MRWLAALTSMIIVLSIPMASAQDASGARQSIEGQLRAFLADDDATAYALAAPNIQRIYPTPDAFMSMVRNGYKPVHRPQNFAFGKSETMASGQIVQQVLLLGPDGKDYEAVYTLELQPDGVYRITGVSLRASNAPGV